MTKVESRAGAEEGARKMKQEAKVIKVIQDVAIWLRLAIVLLSKAMSKMIF